MERWNGGTSEPVILRRSEGSAVSRLSIRVFSRHSRVFAFKRVPTGLGESVGTIDDAKTRKNTQKLTNGLRVGRRFVSPAIERANKGLMNGED
jgi:hypothetical protein